VFRPEDDLIDKINKEIDNLNLWRIISKSYPLFDFDGEEWTHIKGDTPKLRDEILRVAKEVLDDS